MAHAIVPPYLLARIAAVQEPTWAKAAEAARSTLAAPREYRPVRSRLRLSIDDDGTLVAEATPAPDREISDAQQQEQLPGVKVRGEDDPATGDIAVDQAFDGLGATFDFLWDAFGRDSLDGSGGSLLSTVHYGEDYDNAFWNGERMVFGDGDGEVFSGFTGSLTVIAHELAHTRQQPLGFRPRHEMGTVQAQRLTQVGGEYRCRVHQRVARGARPFALDVLDPHRRQAIGRLTCFQAPHMLGVSTGMDGQDPVGMQSPRP